MNNTTNPLVTIAIPTFNRADGHLREAIESALCQSYKNIEIVVSDNCSGDNTGEVVESYGDPRIHYHRHETNIGHNNNFNFCLEQARGEYFLLLCDDDMIDPDFVETCLQHCEGRNDFGIINTGVRIIDAESRYQYEFPNLTEEKSIQEFTRSWFEQRRAVYLCATLFVTERLRELGGFASKHNLAQDTMAHFRLAARHGWVDVKDVKSSARRHAQEITHTSKLRPNCEDSLELVNLIRDLWPESERGIIREEAMRHFAMRNYKLAAKLEKRPSRWFAYFTVLRVFGLEYFPLWLRLQSRAGRVWPFFKGHPSVKAEIPSESGS